MKKLNYVLAIISLCIPVLFTSCEKDQLDSVQTSTTDSSEHIINEGGNTTLSSRASYSLDLQKLATGIEDRYRGKVSGLSYVIFHDNAVYYNGRGGLGWARSTADAPYRDHSAQQRHAIASTSKFPVALLMAKLIEKNGKKLEDKIWPYFPTTWTPSADFKNITFKQLLAHEAGLVKYGNKYAHVKRTVEGGLVNYGNRSYDNINYFMPMYMVAYMIGKWENPSVLTYLKLVESDTTALKNYLAQLFEGALRTNVCKPAGLKYWDKVSWYAWDNNGPIDPANGNKFYTTLSPSEKGTNIANHYLTAGPGGLVISAVEYGQIASSAFMGKIISKNLFGRLRFELLGFDWGGNWNKGYYAAKNGGARGEELLVDFGATQVYVTTNCNFSTVGNDLNFIVNLVNSCVK